MLRAFGVVLAGLVLALPPTTPAAEAPEAPAGSWKVLMPFLRGAGSEPLWIIQFEKKDGKWAGKMTAKAPGAPAATVDNLTVTKEKVQFDFNLKGMDGNRLSIPCELHLKDSKANTLYGTESLRGEFLPLQLDRTPLTSLDPFAVARDKLSRTTAPHEAVQLALTLVGGAERNKVKADEVRSWAAKATKAAGLYGPRFQRTLALNIAISLGQQKGYDPIALQYARQAERLLENKDDARTKKKILDVLVAALEKAGKADEAKEVKARIAKLDFTIKLTPFAGRKGKSDRAVLIELFTGTGCKDCVGAELVFDALGKSFKAGEAVLLEYHLPRPDPDPLATPAAAARAKFYADQIRGIPGLFFNTSSLRLPAGDATDAQEMYNALLSLVGPALERPAEAKLKAEATRKGDKIDVKINVTGLKDKSEEVRLRVLLVEEQVEYKGGNGLAVHHHVVRAFVGKPEGIELKGKDFSQTLGVDLAKVRKEIKDYLDEQAKKKPFAGKVPALDPKKLRVVAFVQNDGINQVLQAIQVPVKE